MEETVIGGPGSQPLDIPTAPPKPEAKPDPPKPTPHPFGKPKAKKTSPKIAPKEAKKMKDVARKKVVAKKAVALPVSAIALARKKAAQMQLKSGDRVTLSGVVIEAIEKFCK